MAPTEKGKRERDGLEGANKLSFEGLECWRTIDFHRISMEWKQNNETVKGG